MTEEQHQSDYLKYRGKCKKLAEAAVAEDPTLRLVRGYYTCPMWRTTEPHWWCERPDGTIVDPTKDQFPERRRNRSPPEPTLPPLRFIGLFIVRWGLRLWQPERSRRLRRTE